MDNLKMMSDIRSAGGWFVGEYAATVFENYDRLQKDNAYKTGFIKRIFNDRGRDSDPSGTRTRVNSLIRIIKRHELTAALEYIIDSENINRMDPEAVKAARQTVEQLNK